MVEVGAAQERACGPKQLQREKKRKQNELAE
jgi:hypothetical protein